jgi:hypothetical protein
MPAIEIARLRKQANRLADFFFVPDEFVRYLREILDFYVNHSLRQKQEIAPGSDLSTYRTPAAVLRQIENQLRAVAEANPGHALDLADLLWDEGALETCLLAAYLLGCMPPQEELMLARLTAWTQQTRGPLVRAALLSTSTARMRRELPGQFLLLIREWLHPERPHTWPHGIQALLPLIEDTRYENLPPIFDAVEPVFAAAHAKIQPDLERLILALYGASPRETTFFLRQLLASAENPLTTVTMRRILPALPTALQSEVQEFLRPARPQKPGRVSQKGP